MTQTNGKPGKTPGNDMKATNPSIVGLEKSREIAKDLTNKTFAALKPIGDRAVAPKALTGFAARLKLGPQRSISNQRAIGSAPWTGVGPARHAATATLASNPAWFLELTFRADERR